MCIRMKWNRGGRVVLHRPVRVHRWCRGGEGETHCHQPPSGSHIERPTSCKLKKKSLRIFTKTILTSTMLSQMVYVFSYGLLSTLHPQTMTKSDFQPSTIKSDNVGHTIVETAQFCPFGYFSKNQNLFILNQKI